ncbi:hypothetical protein DH2020_003825 [Rehmannia glutinosa]|uniref:RNase H type-1 domain-containing protein n=1 Tax=Rehmannia glutinosa TaxID=99300 RepID=A0ABR0XMQ8_REHGL
MQKLPFLTNLFQKKHWTGLQDIAQAAGYTFKASIHLHHLPYYGLNQPNWTKLNIDGDFNNLNQDVGIGGILRNEQGDTLWAFSGPFPQCHNPLAAECQALAISLQLIIPWDTSHLCIETDSTTLCTTIKNKLPRHWSIKGGLTIVHNSLKNRTFSISHVYREGNRVADKIANIGIVSQQLVQYNNDTLPLVVKGLARMDQLVFPSFRIVQRN